MANGKNPKPILINGVCIASTCVKIIIRAKKIPLKIIVRTEKWYKKTPPHV
jgi:hypothetical protein